MTGLLLIVVIGVAALAQGDADFSRNFEFREGESVVAVMVGGASLAFYALIGFEDAVNVAEETKDPSRAFPRALFLGLAVAGVIYLLVTMTASMVVATDVLAESDGALLEVVREGPLGIPVKLFSLIALLAVANGALINMIMASRLVYGMSRQGIVPRAFGRTLEARQTPHVAIVFTTLLAMVLILSGDLESLADTTVILLLGVFVIVNVTVLVLRRDAVEPRALHGAHLRACAGRARGAVPALRQVHRRQRGVRARPAAAGPGRRVVGGQPADRRTTRSRRCEGAGRMSTILVCVTPRSTSHGYRSRPPSSRASWKPV